VPDLSERVDALRREAEAAIAAAPDAAALEDLRVRYLGRKAELTGILRGIGELELEERGPVGSAANAAQGDLERLLARRREELEGDELERSLVEGLSYPLPLPP
jgi:phenylalanyl-tRNA synthetase alpha chain